MIKNTLILTFISFSLSFPLIPQASARISTAKKQVKTQRKAPQKQVPSHIKKKALARRAFIRNYKRLSAKEKLHLITSMVKTMAALELASSRRQGFVHYSEPHPFWSLFIMQAHADPKDKACFLAGHLLDNTLTGSCDWVKARRDQDIACTLRNGDLGVRCNRSVFPSSPCVKDFKDARDIRNYSSTQACAYADAHNIKQHIAAGNNSLDSIAQDESFVDQLTEEDSRNSFWRSGNPEDWVTKRNQILGDDFDQYESLLAGHSEGAVITYLQRIQQKCEKSTANNRFEQKHCNAFKTDLASLLIKTKDCFGFHELPGKHFCQVRVATSSTENDHLVVRLEGNSNIVSPPPVRSAVVYRADYAQKKYCKDSNFENRPIYSSQTSNVKSDNICPEDQKLSSSTAFSYSEQNVFIKKNNRNNMCQFSSVAENNIPDNHYVKNLFIKDNLSNFLPGAQVHCSDPNPPPRALSPTDLMAGTDSFNNHNYSCYGNYQISRVLNSEAPSEKCVDPDVVALRNAASLIKNYTHCGENNITISIEKEPKEGGYVSGTVSRTIWSKPLGNWLENRTSFGEEGGYYKIHIQRKDRVGTRKTHYVTHRNDTPRTTSDWLYGDGKSFKDANANLGLFGAISKLCPPPASAPSASPRAGGGGVD